MKARGERPEEGRAVRALPVLRIRRNGRLSVAVSGKGGGRRGWRPKNPPFSLVRDGSRGDAVARTGVWQDRRRGGGPSRCWRRRRRRDAYKRQGEKGKPAWARSQRSGPPVRAGPSAPGKEDGRPWPAGTESPHARADRQDQAHHGASCKREVPRRCRGRGQARPPRAGTVPADGHEKRAAA